MKKYRSYLTICLILNTCSAQTMPQRGAKRRKKLPIIQTPYIAPNPLASTRSIAIHTHISEKSLEYSHWSGTYTPKFCIHVNNTSVPLTGNTTCAIAGEHVTIRFDYTFMNGYRKGAKEVTYRIMPHTNKLEISFDWNSKWRIIVNNAEPIEIKEVPFSA